MLDYPEENEIIDFNKKWAGLKVRGLNLSQTKTAFRMWAKSLRIPEHEIRRYIQDAELYFSNGPRVL